jgi:uncharacterized membrane protein
LPQEESVGAACLKKFMPISCPECAAQMPDSAAYCPGCGRGMRPEVRPDERAHGTVGALPETLAGALAYFTIVPAIIFLFVEPYSKNRFLRFHSFQSLGLCLVAVVVGAMLRVVGFIVFFIPVLGHLLVWLVSMVVSLAFFAIWAVLVVKALQGEMFKLPLVGDFAEQQAAKD